MGGKVDPTFDIDGSGFDGGVRALALQPDGKIIVGGTITSYEDSNNTYACGGIARLNADGTFDTGFVYGSNKGFDGTAFALALQPDGKIIVGGAFSSYKDANNTYACGNIARLNTDGTFDTSFEYGANKGFSENSLALALQPDGKIIVGGNFEGYRDTSNHSCYKIARLNTNGTLDTSFVDGVDRGFSGAVVSIALQPDGKIIAGGNFVDYEDANSTYICGGIARLNSDGTFDTSFVHGVDKGFNDSTRTLALQPDGKIIVGGRFASYKDSNTYTCNRIARLNIDGTFDTGFKNGTDTGFDNDTLALTLQPDGKIILGGRFASYKDGIGSYSCNNIARLNIDGTFDTNFVNGSGKGFDDIVISLVLQPDDKIIVGGDFVTYNDETSHPCGRIIRLVTRTSFKAPLFIGENFGMSQSVNVNAAKVGSSLTTPITSNPGIAPGSICVSPSGDLLIRKPDGSVGMIA